MTVVTLSIKVLKWEDLSRGSGTGKVSEKDKLFEIIKLKGHSMNTIAVLIVACAYMFVTILPCRRLTIVGYI